MTRAVLLAAVAVVFTAGGVRADDARSVVEKAVTAHGGEEALRKYPGGEYKVEGDVTIGAEKGAFKSAISYALPDKFRMSVETTLGANKTALVVIVNGDKLKATVNGKPQDLKPEAKAEFQQLAAVQEVSLLYPLLDEKKFTLKAEKDEKVDGKEAAVVLVSRKGMKDVRLFFEKETGRLVRFVHKMPDPFGAEAVTEVTQGEFKDFSGVLQPTVQTVKQAGKEYMTLKVTDVKMIENPDPKAYAID